MAAIQKTGIVKYNIITDTHGYPWGHRNGVNGETVHFDLGDNTVGYAEGEFDEPEVMSVECMALLGNHDTAVYGWNKDSRDENNNYRLQLKTYRDSVNKIIFFGLDVGTKEVGTLEIPSREIDQLAEELSELGKGWDVIVLTHAPLFPSDLPEIDQDWDCGPCWGRPGDTFDESGKLNSTPGSYAAQAEEVRKLLVAFKDHSTYTDSNGVTYNFTSSDGYVLGCFAGHVHNPIKVIYKGIPMEAFATNGADEWTKNHNGSWLNMGLYNPILAYISINYDSKTVNGQSFTHNKEWNELTTIGDYHHNEASCFYIDKAAGYFHMKPAPTAHPKFYDGVYIGYSGSPLDGTSFGKNGHTDRYWPFETSISLRIGSSTVSARAIWFDTNGRLRYYTNSTNTSSYISYVPINNYKTVTVTFTTNNVNWTFQNGLLVSAIPIFKAGSFTGKNGYGITFDSNGIPKGVTLNGGNLKDYGVGENYINVTRVQIYSGPDYKEITTTPQIGITSTFNATSQINLARSTSSGANQCPSTNNLLMRVEGNNGAVIWLYNGKLTALTDAQVL